MVPVLSNTHARRLFLHLQGLSRPPNSRMSCADLLDLIESMGFVQIDSINTVDRAHHMILFSRNQTYRHSYLSRLLEDDRTLFENWTHDASIVPSRYYPYWQHRFRRNAPVLRERWKNWRREGFEEQLEQVYRHVSDHGPTKSRDLRSPKKLSKKSDGWWDWHPAKTALEFHWHTGRLAVTRREGFQKVYDLCEHVIPEEHRTSAVDETEFIDWACRSALDRLGFATPGEIAAFWDIISPSESKEWCNNQPKEELMTLDVESFQAPKPHRVFANPNVLQVVQQLPSMPKRMRVLSPFDPVLRDRKRALRLFGFDYRIEVFVPEKKRQYGYYVFPLLECDKIIGRIDMKCLRKESVLKVSGLWLEPGVQWNKGRASRLHAELDRVRRFTGMSEVEISGDFLKQKR